MYLEKPERFADLPRSTEAGCVACSSLTYYYDASQLSKRWTCSVSRPCSFRKPDKFFCSSGKQVGFIFQINTIVQFKIWSFSSKAQYNAAFLIRCTVWEVAFSRHNICCLCIAPLLSRDALVCNWHGALILITCSAVTGGWEVWGGGVSSVFSQGNGNYLS